MGIRGERLRAHLPLASLVLVHIFYYTDRFILNMLIEPVRLDLGLTDGEIGVLTGVAFAISYALMTLPVGRLTDSVNRVWIVAVAVTVWSLFTALFGFAKSYAQMLLLRVGVACGEAGGFIPIQSIIGDLYPPERRATALAVLLAGASVGKMAAFAAAGFLNDAIGWRMTFVIVGLSGVFMGPLVLFMVREPMRGALEGLQLDQTQAATTTRRALTELMSRSAFPAIIGGLTVASVGVYAMLTWLPTFFIRRFDMTTTEAGILISVITVAPNIVGMVVGGIVSDRLFKRDPRWVVWVPGIALAVAGPALVVQLFAPNLTVAVVAGLLPGFVTGVYAPAVVAALHAVSGVRLRGMAGAFLAFAGLLVGQGVGPALTGFLSDFFAAADAPLSYTSLRNSLAIASAFFVVGGTALILSGHKLVGSIAAARRFDESGVAPPSSPPAEPVAT